MMDTNAKKLFEVDWGYGTISQLIEKLGAALPLSVPVNVEKSDDPASVGTWFDGEKVTVTFHYTMAFAAVQLHVLTGYALAIAFGDKLVPTNRGERADFHNALYSVYFEVSKFDNELGETYKNICMPQAMQFVDHLMERAVRMPEMN